MKTIKPMLFAWLLVGFLLQGCGPTVEQSSEVGQSETDDIPQSKSQPQHTSFPGFVPCEECEMEGSFVSELPSDWSEAQVEIYHLAIGFWDQLGAEMFSSEMMEIYDLQGGNAYKSMLIAKLGDPGSTDDEFQWSGRFLESAIDQVSLTPIDNMPTPMPKSSGSTEYMKWSKEAARKMDLVFEAGAVQYLGVEAPILHDPDHAIVKLKQYDLPLNGSKLSLQSSRFYYFDRIDGQWNYVFHRDQ